MGRRKFELINKAVCFTPIGIAECLNIDTDELLNRSIFGYYRQENVEIFSEAGKILRMINLKVDME